MKELLPKILYKYTSWSGDKEDPKTNIIFKNILWFSNPIDFNDPFDSMLPIRFDDTYFRSKEFYYDWINAMVKIGKEKLTPSEIDQKVKMLLLKPDSVLFSTEIMTSSIRSVVGN